MVAEDQVAKPHPKERLPDNEPCAWVSDAVIKSELLFGFTCQMAADDIGGFVALIKAAKRGELLSSADLPSEMWVDLRYNSDNRRKLPNLFKANGFLTISEPFAEVLRHFDLGRTRLHPVDLWHSDRKERFDGQYYFLNIGEVRRQFLPDQSAHWKRFEQCGSTYLGSISGAAQDDALALAPAALTGPALWLDDTILSTIFFSDPLVQALRAAKLTRQLPLYRCRVATVN